MPENIDDLDKLNIIFSTQKETLEEINLVIYKYSSKWENCDKIK